MNPLDALAAHPRRFSLLAAMRAIERAHADRPRIGTSPSLREDPVRVIQPPYLAFAPCEMEAFHDDGPVPRLSQYPFGMLGPAGPLPLHLTEYALERWQRAEDTVLIELLAALQHRVLTLQYRTWTLTNAAASADRPEDDAFGEQLASIVGLGEGAAIGSRASPDVTALLARAGLLVAQSRPAEALAALLHDWLNVPIEVREFCGEWLPIPREQRTTLGQAWCTLGEHAVLGAESWQAAHRFEVVAGPLSLDELRRLLPGTTAARSLTELVRHYTHRQWSWRLRLRLRAGEAPRAALDGSCGLGWTSWLGTRRGEACDVALEGDPGASATTNPWGDL